ncbi:hypothetical protein A8B78_08550 [Jannaschia sp. EhC01]|nr:hypothetical protein A8B78_08550 [Jannaschia sp. EhC01]
MRFFRGITLVLFLGFGAVVQAMPFEPGPGSDLRRELLDTLRPLAAYDLGAPLVFRVLEISVDGDVAFARLIAQRPGGAEIDLSDTPMVAWRNVDPFEIDGPRFEAFFVRHNGHWQVVQYALGSSDAWWYGNRCDVFGTLLREQGC